MHILILIRSECSHLSEVLEATSFSCIPTASCGTLSARFSAENVTCAAVELTFGRALVNDFPVERDASHISGLTFAHGNIQKQVFQEQQ